MELLVKDKLKQKQIVNPHELVKVDLKGSDSDSSSIFSQKEEKTKEKEEKEEEKKEKTKRTEEKENERKREKRAVTIIDERNTNRGITEADADNIMKKLREKRLSKVTVRFPEEKPMTKIEEEPPSKTQTMVEREEVKKTKKPKKIKTQLILEEEGEKTEGREEKNKEEKEGKRKEKPELEEIELVIEDEEPILKGKEKEIKEKSRVKKEERITEKVKKGVAELGPEQWVKIDSKPIFSRLPPKEAPVKVKLSSYYMANRKIFVNSINTFFERYRKELQQKEQVSCEGLRSVKNFSLLTHQQIVRDYMNLYTPYRGLLLYHNLGSGKCHAKGTPIIMSDGSIQLIENIKVGDLLMGDDSKPRTVLSLAKGKDKMYDIIPVKGEKYTVNQEHILCLRASGFPKLCYSNNKINTNYNVQWLENNKFKSKTFTFSHSKNNETEIKKEAELFFENIKRNTETSDNIYEVSVKDYLKLSDKKRAFLKGYKVPIDFPEKELPMDPYMIGYWLGDGTNSRSEITSQDSTVLYYFVKNLQKYNVSLQYHTKYTYGITGNGKYYNNVFLNTLKSLNMLNNKHIPTIYKCNSRENRLKLLAGLLDSDGCYDSTKGCFEFTQKNETLMDDMIYLCRSLGFACYKSVKKTSWTHKGVKNEGTAFRITISGSGLEEIPTVIPRKRANPRRQIKDVLVTGIKVEYVNEDNYYGFMLDGNCRYLIGDFTVTHNTCTSIAIAEGMKSHKKVVVMTPKSLRENYMEELKTCGDFMYKKKQHWDWISDPDAFETLSTVLGLPLEYIKKRGGAWLVDVSKSPESGPPLSSQDMKSLDAQLNEMIQNKYGFINYNGMRENRLKALTNDYEKNPFDNAVVIIDEAHNFISRIVNKLKREKLPETNRRGEKESLPLALSLKLYEFLLSAQNARVVLLSGTPIINYPNEVAILFNILRGYIKTWEIPLNVKTSKKISSETLQKALQGEKIMDFLDYSPSSKKLFITRNPLGFKNKIKVSTGYHGVTGEKKNAEGKMVFDTDFISDDAFERKIIGMLRDLDIDVVTEGIRIHNYKALPDKFEDFMLRFVDEEKKEIKNIESFKKRILGLTSYFRSAQEGLLPRYEKTPEYYHVVKIPMSDYQFKLYEAERVKERTMDSSSKKKQAKVDKEGIYKETSSTYRIFSRSFCNYVMPRPPGRPMPVESSEVSTIENLLKEAKKVEDSQDVENEREGEIEGDEVLNAIADSTYTERMASAIAYMKEHKDEVFSKTALQTYGPKFLSMLENIQDEEYRGLHLVYSQFRTLEGIGLFALTLEANGFARFKIKKNTSGSWDLDIDEEDEGKPTYALYTGTESDDEKRIMLKIYNGIWDDIPTQISTRLKQMANNNNMGEIIKVLMITSSGSEGINLRNTRYVHVMEPYWHPVRTEQVIGRARRICSHKDLPDALQTVDVFMYLMTFTKEQIEGNSSLRQDLSEREPKVPLTSDEYLYEVSTIKEEIARDLLVAIKETSIDCAVYSRNSKENLHCISFEDPDPNAFSYYPNITNDPSDTVAKLNKDKVTWTAMGITIHGIKYAARQMKENLYKIYDLDSYKKAKEKGGDPIYVGTVEIMPDGKKVVNMGV